MAIRAPDGAKNGHILSTGQCYAPSEVYSVIVLHGIAWCCLVLHGIAWYCMVLYGIVWYLMVSGGQEGCLHRMAGAEGKTGTAGRNEQAWLWNLRGHFKVYTNAP